MLRLFVVVSVLATVLPVAAVPDWAKEVIAQPVPETDFAASSVTLFYHVDLEVRKNGECIRRERRVELGLRHYVSLTNWLYGHQYTRLKKAKAWLLDGDHEVQDRMDKDDVIVIGDWYDGDYVYTDDQDIILGWPSLDSGSIGVFESEMVIRPPWSACYQAVTIHVQEPILRAYVTVDLPNEWGLSYHYSGSATDPVRDPAENSWRWTFGPLSFVPDEPMMPDWLTVMSVLQIQAHDLQSRRAELRQSSWEAVSDWVTSIHNPPADPTTEVTGIFSGTGLDNWRDKLQYFQKSIRYTSLSIGEGRFIPRSASETLRARFGDCKDKAALARAVLTYSGVPSASVLTAVLDPFVDSFATPFQFNHCIVGVPASTLHPTDYSPAARVGDWVLYDPTDESTPFGELPPILRGAPVLVIDSSTTEPQWITEPTTADYGSNQTITITVNERGDVQVDGTKQLSTLTSRLQRYFLHSIGPDLYRDSALVSWTEQGWSMTEFVIDSSGSEWTITFAGFNDRFAREMDGYLVLPSLPQLLVPFDHLPDGPRHHAIDLTVPRESTREIEWRLPEGWRLSDEYPEFSYESDIGLLFSQLHSTDQGVRLSIQHRVEGGVWPKEWYEEVQQLGRVIDRVNRLRLLLEQEET